MTKYYIEHDYDEDGNTYYLVVDMEGNTHYATDDYEDACDWIDCA